MKKFCNVISDFCSPAVQERMLYLYKNLKKHNLFPQDINFEHNDFDTKNNNLFFVTFNKSTEQNLRNLMHKIDFKKRQIVIISNNRENYFDFAMEYNICNIVHLESLNEALLLGILKRFFNKESGLEFFFEKEKNIFDKRYSISGNICMHNLVENKFADFIDKIHNITKSTFIINCHELITNAMAYGILGITAHARDKKAHDIRLYSNISIPQGKDVKVHLVMNENFYGIAVRDPGGTLTIQRILERIRRQSIVAGETIPQGIEDHTGRGLVILSHQGLLVFSIKPGEFTDVSLISRIKASFEKRPISILAKEL